MISVRVAGGAIWDQTSKTRLLRERNSVTVARVRSGMRHVRLSQARFVLLALSIAAVACGGGDDPPSPTRLPDSADRESSVGAQEFADDDAAQSDSAPGDEGPSDPESTGVRARDAADRDARPADAIPDCAE